MKPTFWSKTASPTKSIFANMTCHIRTSSILFNNWLTIRTISNFTTCFFLWPCFKLYLIWALRKIMKIQSTFPTNFCLTFLASYFYSCFADTKRIFLSDFFRIVQLNQIFTVWFNTIHNSWCILCHKKISFKL